jgi:hypothetical protein
MHPWDQKKTPVQVLRQDSSRFQFRGGSRFQFRGGNMSKVVGMIDNGIAVNVEVIQVQMKRDQPDLASLRHLKARTMLD